MDEQKDRGDRGPMDPTRKLLKVFGVKVTDYESKTDDLLARWPSSKDAERAAIARLPFDTEDYRAQLGVPALVGEKGYTVLEQRWTRPTLDVNGIWGGWTGDGPKTILPAWVAAKVSCRLVPNQDPERIFALVRDHITAVTPRGVRSEVRLVNIGRPAITPIDHPATQEAFAALKDVFGREPVFIRVGGTVPVAASFQSLLGLEGRSDWSFDRSIPTAFRNCRGLTAPIVPSGRQTAVS